MEITQFIQSIERLQIVLQTASLSAVEKDILLKKVAVLYENLLNKYTVQRTVEAKAEVEFAVVEEKITEEKPAVAEVLATEPAKVVEEIKHQESADVRYISPEKPKEEPKTLLDAKAEKTLLNERFQPQSKGLNERVVQGDLKKLIDFNRQFVFIQELFQNDAISYMKTIERINETEKIEDAILYLNNEIIHKYKWKPEQESVKLFEKIVRQKFGA